MKKRLEKKVVCCAVVLEEWYNEGFCSLNVVVIGRVGTRVEGKSCGKKTSFAQKEHHPGFQRGPPP